MKAIVLTAMVAAAMISASAIVSAAEPTRVPVLVRGAEADGGFTDPSKDRQDSVKDLKKKLHDSDSVRLVDSESDATVVLEVLNRETKREVNGWTAFSGAAQNKSYLTVRLIVGDYATEFTGESGSKGMLKGYGAAAGEIAKQLEAWVKANRERLNK